MTNTGVPFMPKTAKSKETQILFFFSKHKFILESCICTSGVPYSDTFQIEYKHIV